jgi:hypothetical protein
MTVKEIAELCGVDERTVLRWAHKAAEKASPAADILSAETISPEERRIAQSIKEKLESSGHGFSADYDLRETLSTIGDGGKNKTLSALLEENAANKERLATESNYEGLLKDIERLIDGKIQAALAPVIVQNEQKRLPSPPELPDGDKIRAFVGKYLEITGRGAHFITLDDAFTLYQRETGDGIPRNILSYQMLRAYPVLAEKMRKVEHRMEKVITGCRPQERLTTNGTMFCMDTHYKVMFDD